MVNDADVAVNCKVELLSDGEEVNGETPKGPSINDVTQNFGVLGPPPPLSHIHATYQYCLSAKLGNC